MEQLSWEQKSNYKSELLGKLTELMHTAIMREMQDISSKIEVLFQMGFIKDEEKIKELRQKINELKSQGPIDASTDNS
jgi:polyhydroxyalkanoate synthesis regulator phasin